MLLYVELSHPPLCHIYASVNWISIASGNGLSPIQRQAITWTNAHFLSIGPFGTNFREIRIKIPNFSFKEMYLKMSSTKWWPFSPGENESKFRFTSSLVRHNFYNASLLQIILKEENNLNISQSTLCLMSWQHQEPGGRFKNAYELLTLRALKFSYVNKIHIFQCMGKIFCVEFQRYPLKFHTKYLTHTLKDMIFMQFWNFKSS